MPSKSSSCSFLFVYGSLRRESSHPMARMLARRAWYLGPARFNGALYRINTYCGAVPSSNPNDQIVGDLYRMRYPKELVRRLDPYEGFNIWRPDAGEFHRRIVLVSCTGTHCADRVPTRPDSSVPRARLNVRSISKVTQKAWIYLYNRPIVNHPRLESGDFLGTIGSFRAAGDRQPTGIAPHKAN